MGNLNEWTWEPPTSPSARREKENRVSLANFRDRLVKWLEASDFDKPYLQPPEITTQVAKDEIRSRTESAHVELAQKIANMRTAICQTHNVDKRTMARWKTKLRRTLQNRISAGHLSIEEVLFAMEPLDSITRHHIADDELALSFTTDIQVHIVSVLGSLRRNDNENMFLRPWVAVANKILSMDGTDGSFTAMRYMVKESLASDRHNLAPDQLLTKTRQFLTTQSSRKSNIGVWLLRFARFAQTIDRLDTTQQEAIMTGMQAFVSESHNIQARGLQYCWLLLQAHSKYVSQADFEAQMDGFLTTHGSLKDFEAWQLSTARLLATRVIDSEHHAQLVKKFETMRQRWITLSSSLSHSAQDTLTGFCHNLRVMQSPHYLGTALVSSNHPKEHPAALGVLRDIITNPTINHRFIWDAIDTESKSILSAIRHTPRPASRTRTKAFLGMLDKISHWYQSAHLLRDRKALAGAERCLRTYRMINGRKYQRGRVSCTVLNSFTKIVIRDLEKGQFGRTERLTYLLRVVAEERGVEEAKKLRQILQGWRQRIHENSGMA